MTAAPPTSPSSCAAPSPGFADPRVIEHLVKLGVTAVELMPIQAFFDDRYLVEKGSCNYWGYNTIGFFAPAPRYISPARATLHEFKEMVRRLHEAGIEVILDVVYNHTAEGNQLGPTLSFRGIDNASYYMLGADQRFYFDTHRLRQHASTSRHPRVLQMVMDSLRYWVEELPRRRLPLRPRDHRSAASTHGFDHQRRLLRRGPAGPGAVAGEADRRAVGPRPERLPGRQLSRPAGREWNGRYRDDDARLLEGRRRHMLPALRRALLALRRPLRARSGRKPWASVNFITAHDGFTLADLVVLQRASTTRRTARTTATATTTTAAGTAASRGRPTIRRSCDLRDRCGAASWRRCSCRRARRCS